ncbi:GGDEF domain-containing protein [Pseudomonas mosselii]|uniref:GGDEF domain-containing protein n=1 Tax=Pseudomonas TaxID=286 RepID=UPI000B5953E2|nr:MULTISPECIES: GGDEF domain-containing protein [Pseudomonas]MCH7420383.1 GGDEF domain-containing protein [Pseudomonas mosselii]MDH0630168.1 GGDEF domain-containing protein [Pseudomonas mosselii]MDH0680045.1 GGDEF domain-containing protein [Pseudomonas mosselii]MDH0927702.1 GGDEF domain-containing protein [Pseudomonas mosselii]MDH1136629.1 GGDEF domain-containing protein [Pseudomonas mosselii]
MAFDACTLLTLSIALAAVAALYLAVEWISVRESSLLCWSASFATISVGSSLALLRGSGYLFIGIWFANGMLVAAHWLFLLGVSRFTETRLSRACYLAPLLWASLLLLPQWPLWSKTFLVLNSLLVAGFTLYASALLRPHGKSLSVGAVQLRYILLLHGLFYLAKTLPALLPGTLIDLTAFRGQIIQASLLEGAMAIMLIALSMTGTVRYRREERIERLAARDPLTALYNRRALEVRAANLLKEVSAQRPGALLLIDIDHFKLVNDLHGHAAGDRLLVALSEMIRALLPERSIAARLGGDEFVILLGDASRQAIEQLADALRRQFQATAEQAFRTPEAVTLSIGANLFDRPPASLAALIEQGDVLLYASKRGGRNSLQLVDGLRG